ncbi:MAG: HhH-GDP family DNA glycosylase [Planctomycetota bacterium]
MKDARQCAQSFARLLKKIGKPPAPAPSVVDDAVTVLVMSFLMWDCTTSKATAAYKRLMERVVDFNDLRVSMPHEILECIGPRYPRALERCQRLRAVLRHTYKREHAVSLERLRNMGKREVKKYLRTLDGIASYVADRVMLLCFDTHCIPVDERLRRALVKATVCDESMGISELASWLARHVKASEAADTHRALQAWSDRVSANTAASSAAKPSSGRSAGKTGRKTAVTSKKKKKKTARSQTG